MSYSSKKSDNQFKMEEIDLFDCKPYFKMEGYYKQCYEISDENQGKQSTSNEYRQQSSDLKILKRIDQDESQINNVYDLEQINYRLFMNQEYERSLMIQQRLMNIVYKNPEYYHQQALTYLALNDINNANKFYEDAILMSPQYDRYFFDYEIAEHLPELFIDSIRYIQNNIDCYKEQENQLISECLFAYHVYICQRPQKSVKMLMMLIQRYPKSYLPYFYASKCYHHVGNYFKALEFINNSIMCFRYKDIQLYNLKGRILIQSGDLDDAIRVYSLFPKNKYFQTQLGKKNLFHFLLNLLKMKIDKDKQQELLKQTQKVSIKELGKLEQEFQEIGMNYYKQRKYEKSRLCFLKALEQNPNNGLCQFMITKCYLKLGDLDNASKHHNISIYNYDNDDGLVKLFNKIENEKKRFYKNPENSYQSRIIL